MEESKPNGVNPKLVISQYFDSLIRQVDIYTEETLQLYTDADVFEIEPSRGETSKQPDHTITPYSLCDHNSIDFGPQLLWKRILDSHKLDLNDNLTRFGPEPINKRIYVNQMRDQLIKELEKGQSEAFEYYETIKNEIDKSMSQEDIESIVFANNYYFIIIRKIYYPQVVNPFKMHLVKLDFYLNCRERDLLK